MIPIEENMGHGAIPIHPVRRFFHRLLFRKRFKKGLVKGLGFDWTTGFDVQNQIGSIAIKNQGTNDSCSGQAGSYFLEVQRRLQGVKEGAISAKSIYAPIAYPGGGTTVSALETQLCAHGANLEAKVPSYDVNGNPLSEAMMEDMSWHTPDLIKDAFTRAGYTPYDIHRDIDSVAYYTQQYGACIFEIAGQNNGTWTSPMPLPPSSSNPNGIWHHFMCCIGATMYNGKKTLICLQSEGTTWGDNGVQYISEDYFTAGGIIDAFTCIFDPNIKVIPLWLTGIWLAIYKFFMVSNFAPQPSSG